jgi:hypothetical protein
MRLRSMRCFLLAGGLAAGMSCAAHVGPFDPTFGDGGMRAYGFQPGVDGNDDEAVVGCPGVGGTLYVLGHASSTSRMVLMRILANGDYDPTFGSSGRASLTVPGTYAGTAAGLCQPDGKLVVARNIEGSGGRDDLQIVRVDPATAQLDVSFGAGSGIVQPTLAGASVYPLGVNALPDGRLAVSGIATIPTAPGSGFVALVGSDGTGLVYRRLAQPATASVTAVTAAPDGRLWVYGANERIAGAYRATLDAATLAWLGVVELGNGPAFFNAGAGRSVDAQTGVLPGICANASTRWPCLAVFRGTTASWLMLPAASLGATNYQPARQLGNAHVTALPGRRVLYATSVESVVTFDVDAVHYAMARIGRSAGTDRIETAFASGGAQTATFRPAVAACQSPAPSQDVARLTLWSARPVVVGQVDMNCVDSGGDDYLVARIESNYLFGDGFD